ncbi:hypothetical protein BTA51_09935 [Hahella sp. CCB-MM4]|uniref:hypothetical protein n=1 Tax=Hahella sp. (strain CCB-MM4) TaxID=1926491 RepID=UPI000BD8E239|nr:hypothetical protein [Hahella sp. CCB-MM4]OZG73344.1 hypothetical protein BTA51_09935 [Hahella sp. CCB-MM4]
MSAFRLAPIAAVMMLGIVGCSGGSNNGNSGSSAESLGNVIFPADDGVHGTELWITDGTEENTRLVKDLNEAEGSNPQNIFKKGDITYFVANDGIHGYEIWKTDGTEEGTEMVADAFPWTESADLSEFTEFKNELYFTADIEGTPGRNIWKTDGTEAGTKIVATGRSPSNFVATNDRLFYTDYTSETGSELYAFNGEKAYLVKDIFPGGSSSQVQSLTAFNNKVYFVAISGDAPGYLIWKSDGTADGTSLAEDSFLFNGGAEIVKFKDSILVVGTVDHGETIKVVKLEKNGDLSAHNLPLPGPELDDPSIEIAFDADSRVFIVASYNETDNPSRVEYLWSTENGTDFNSLELTQDIYDGIAFNSNMYLDWATEEGVQLWTTNGTQEGTRKVKDINDVDAKAQDAGFRINGLGYNPYHLPVVGTTANPSMLFIGVEPTTGAELWKTDGTAEGTVLVKDIQLGDASSFRTRLLGPK